MGRANPTGARIAAGEVGLPDERARTGVAPYPGLAHRPRTGMAVALVALVCLTVTAFAPVFFNDFVLYDDPANFLNNHDFRGIGWHQFAWSWRAHILGIYQPLGWQIHSVESALWGMGPWGYHLTSVIFHTANVLVFFLVTLELLARSRPDLPAGDRCSGAALASALFAVHPLRVEAVAWASCQTYLHCATFWLLSVLAYLRANRREDPGPWRLFVCWLLALAAMLCKATAVTLPIVLLILDFYPLRRLGSGVPAGLFGPAARRVWLEKVPLLVMSAILAAAAVFAQVGVWAKFLWHRTFVAAGQGLLCDLLLPCEDAVAEQPDAHPTDPRRDEPGRSGVLALRRDCARSDRGAHTAATAVAGGLVRLAFVPGAPGAQFGIVPAGPGDRGRPVQLRADARMVRAACCGDCGVTSRAAKACGPGRGLGAGLARHPGHMEPMSHLA